MEPAHTNQTQGNKVYLLVAVVVIIAGLLWYFFGRTEVISVSENTTVSGDYVVKKGTRVEVSNGAVITVEGNTTIAGEIKGDKNGVAIVAKGNLAMDASAKIVSGGTVQIVGHESALLNTQEKIDAAFDEAGQDTGVGPRVGPFAPTAERAGGISSAKGNPMQNLHRVTLDLGGGGGVSALLANTARTAYAHDGANDELPDLTVTLSGTIDLSGADASDEAKRKKIVILSFPPSAGKVEMKLKDLTITGPQNTPKGKDDKGKSCDARGGDGADGLRLRGFAWNIEIANFNVTLAKGGDGGDAETTKDCDPGVAHGGSGGDSGNMKLVADHNFKITGTFGITPGKSGDGGGAIAHGRDGGGKGGDARAYGGKGKDNNKELSVKGTVEGTNNVEIGVLVGGNGGSANADGGKGSDGIACGQNGGIGGNAHAEGGKGGSASLVVLGAPSPVFDTGGNGGSGEAKGGAGGNGGSCDAKSKGKGGNGGKGGDASAKEGKGGAGDTAGVDGTKIGTGGRGGNGGSGCPEGKGGKGGAGDIPGPNGADGQNLCVTEEPKTTGKVGGGTQTTTGTTPVAPTAGMTFAHVAPGQYSEVYMDITGTPGMNAQVTLSGPAVEQTNASGTIDANGKLRLTWRIYQYGTYNATGMVGNSSINGRVAVN